MGSSQRHKGSDGERELVRHLRDPVERNLDQPRCGGRDVLLTGWSVEVKRAQAVTFRPWWAQAVDQVSPVAPADQGWDPPVTGQGGAQ